jgi:hypothetical protein
MLLRTFHGRGEIVENTFLKENIDIVNLLITE